MNQEKKNAYVAVIFHEVGEKQFDAQKGKKNRSILKSIFLNFLNRFVQKNTAFLQYIPSDTSGVWPKECVIHQPFIMQNPSILWVEL